MTSPHNTGVPLRGADEHDAFSKRSRRLLCVFDNHTGLVKKVKRAYNKRVRKTQIIVDEYAFATLDNDV